MNTTAQSAVSQAQQQKDAQEEIEKLMSQFSAMGVNLNTPLRCGDTAARVKFNSAKALYTEIYTLAKAYGLTKKYDNFFAQNGQNIFSACKK